MASRIRRLSSVLNPRGTYQTLMPYITSKYRRTIVIIAPLMKYGGEVALTLLSRTGANVRVIVVTPHFKDIETLRSQLESSMRKRLISRECELHSISSIKMVVLWLREKLDRIDTVIHLAPLAEPSAPERFQPLICANDYSVNLFTKELRKYFGFNIDFLLLEYELTETAEYVAQSAFEETMQ